MRPVPALLLLLSFAAPARAQVPGAYQPGRIESAMLPATANRAYKLLAPPDVPAGTKLPLVIYLHGAGSKGDDNTKPAAEILPALLAKADVRKRFPCYVLVPQCKDGTTADGRPMNWVNWEGQKDNPPAKWEKGDVQPSDHLRGAMLALAEVLEKHRGIDRDRVYLTGVSMGGSGSCNWAARSPDHFAAVIACCGLGEASKAKQFVRVPLMLFHGSDDPVAPVQRSRDLAKAVTDAGGKATLVEYTGAGHNIAGTTFTEKDFAALTWLFAQKRATPPPAVPLKGEPSPADAAFFEAKVRPVLTKHCAECHGEKKQKGGLRLDSRAAALTGGDLGPAVVPGRPADSPLVKAVRYHDDLQMPPKGKLPDAVVTDLTEWVKRGAPWPGATGPAAKAEGGITDEMRKHWAFQPIRRHQVPGDRKQETPNPIDAFLLAKLAEKGLAYSSPADARTLARRLSFDLTGLPPAPERVAAFVTAHAADPRAAVSDYVAELLASPRYGERWGRHWLDVARYADTNGSEVDHAMANAWRYRDYVIRAFNDDKPFDQFVREQVAGDLLGTPDGLVASGFLVLGPKALAELDKEVFLNDVADEQLDTVGKAFVGLTLGCARCHDHKFDPVTAKDYAALAGIFKSAKSVDVSKRVATWTERPLAGGDPARAAELDRRIVELRAERAKAAATKSGPPVLAAGAKFLLIEAEDFTTSNVRVDRDQLGKGIGVVRTRMEYPDHIEYEFTLPAAGEYQLELRYAAKESRPTHLLVNDNLEDMDAADGVTGDWTPAAQRWFVQGTYAFKAGKNTLGFRRDGPVPLFDKWLVGAVLPGGKKHSDALGAAVAKKGPAPKADLQKIDAQIAAVEAEREKVPTALAPLDGPGKDIPVLIRGNPATPGPIAPRGFPAFLTAVSVPAPGPAQSGRRELAEWLVHPANPLTPRVIVNRVWTWHFGEGLVRSPDNFGLRGERPSHPELLDWLAAWFVENGWSVKKLNALICTSAAYQQSAGRPVDADPENRLLGRWPRPRLDAEQVRDALLAVGGNLDVTAGGSVMEVMNRTYATGGNAPPDVVKRMHYDRPRRSVYLPVVRNAVYDLFAAFDFPEPGTVTGKRDATTVAPQALFLMNSPFVREQGKKLAERVSAAGDDAARVRLAYELAYSRPPTDAEVAAAVAFVERDAAALGRPAAWARLCHALLAANEFLYVR